MRNEKLGFERVPFHLELDGGQPEPRGAIGDFDQARDAA